MAAAAATLVDALTELAFQRERFLLVGERLGAPAAGVLRLTQAVECLVLPVAVFDAVRIPVDRAGF